MTATSLNGKIYQVTVTGASTFTIELPVVSGSHTGGTHATILTDSQKDWVDDELVGFTITNITDGSTGVITANDATTVTVAALAGGGDDQWELNDLYMIGEPVDGTDIGAGGTGSCKRIYQIVSPYTSSEAFEIHTTQSADVVYIAHEDHHPQKLSRLSDTEWTIADVDFTGGPFLEENTDEAKTLQFIINPMYWGSHTGANDQATILTDAAAEGWVASQWVGETIYNQTDLNVTTGVPASGVITANDATTATVAALAGGSENDWDTDDLYTIGFTGYYYPAGLTGTLEAVGHTPFNSNHVGSLWLLKNTRADNQMIITDGVVTSTSPGKATDGIRIKGDYNIDASEFAAAGGDTLVVERKQGDGEWQVYRKFQAAVAYSATEEEADVFYRISVTGGATIDATLTARNQVNRGIVQITAVTDSDTAVVTVIEPVYRPSTATSMWAEGAWSDYRGYPRTLAFYEDRLWWASSTNNPDTLWSSKTGDYENMEFTDLGVDDDALVLPINDKEVSQVQWMMAREVMAVGGANKTYRVSASNPEDPITPDDRKAIPQRGVGSYHIQPVFLNDSIFFFQINGRKLRAIKFDPISETFVVSDATILANTLLESTPICMAVQRTPDSIIWITRTDGVLLSLSYEPDEEVVGWARNLTKNISNAYVPEGYFESVASKYGDTEDEIWLSVKRIINGSTQRYIERFTPRLFDEIDEAVMLDSAVVVSSGFGSKILVLASDTVRCGDGSCGSSLCGGVTS